MIFYLRIGNTEDCEESDEANKLLPTSSSSVSLQSTNDQPDNHGLWIGSSPNDLVSGFEYTIQQYKALYKKRLIHSLRNRSLVIAQLVIPIGILIVNLLSLKYGPIKPEDSPALTIDLIRYSRNFVPYTYTENETSLNRMAQIFASTVNSRANSKSFWLNDTQTVKLCNNSRGTVFFSFT